jgi:ribosomal protein L12E/L44/L45/RPP1/RPP2
MTQQQSLPRVPFPPHTRTHTTTLTPPQVQAQIARSLAVKGELQRLEEQALEDRVRIQRLLSLPQPLRGGDVTIVLPSSAAPFPLAAAATAAGAAAAAAASSPASAHRRQQEGEGGDVASAADEPSVGEGGGGGGGSQAQRKRGEWVGKALKTERDPEVARLLREIKGGMQVGGGIGGGVTSYQGVSCLVVGGGAASVFFFVWLLLRGVCVRVSLVSHAHIHPDSHARRRSRGRGRRTSQRCSSCSARGTCGERARVCVAHSICL